MFCFTCDRSLTHATFTLKLSTFCGRVVSLLCVTWSSSMAYPSAQKLSGSSTSTLCDRSSQRMYLVRPSCSDISSSWLLDRSSRVMHCRLLMLTGSCVIRLCDTSMWCICGPFILGGGIFLSLLCDKSMVMGILYMFFVKLLITLFDMSIWHTRPKRTSAGKWNK